MINCKDFLPSNKDIDKVIENLGNAEYFIKQKYSYLNAKNFKKIYVYGGSGKKSIAKAQYNNIVTIGLKLLLVKYFKELDNYLSNMNFNRTDIPKGKRYYIIDELEELDKFISFLLNNNFINDQIVNNLLAQNNINPFIKSKMIKSKSFF